VSFASVDNAPKKGKRKKPMDASLTENRKKKAQPVEPDCTKKCSSFWNLIASLPRWMSVPEIERQDKNEHNYERGLHQEFQYQMQVNKIVEKRGISFEDAELVYLQEVGQFTKSECRIPI
jgi:hypothetical protein